MKSMSRALLTLAATALVLTGFSTRAEATAITIDNIITTATTVDADLVVSGLNEVIGGFAFQIGYTPADFTGANITNDPLGKLGNGLNPILDFSGGFGFPVAGTLDVDVLSGFFGVTGLATATALQGPFPASFTLSHVQFLRSASTAGTKLSLLNPALSKFDGSTTIPLGNATPVPEPATMLLLGSGLVAAAARRRKQNKSQL